MRSIDRLRTIEPFSYRRDPAVPAFPDDKPLVVFDGDCVLCSRFATFILERDPDAMFRMTTAQSPLGQALFQHYGLDRRDFETNLVLDGGRPYVKLDSVVIVGRRLAGPWRAAAMLRLLPRALSDWIYDRIARNRYALFGRHDRCMMPPAQWQDRFLI